MKHVICLRNYLFFFFFGHRPTKRGKYKANPQISVKEEAFKGNEETKTASLDWHDQELEFAMRQSWYVGLRKTKTFQC
jgi:hypothetical protein